MDINEHTSSEHHSEHDAEPHPHTLRLVRAIAARLRTPLEPARRDALAATLAATAAGAADAGTERMTPARARAAARWGSPGVRRLVAAAAALVVVAGTVGVVTRSGDDLPVFVLAAGAGQGGLGQGGPMAADGAEGMRVADAASPMIGLWLPTEYRFVLADGVGITVGRAPAWLLVPPADLAAAAARIAAEFGLSGLAPSEWDPTALSVQTEGGANLWVSPNGDWYYGGPSDLWPVWDCPAVPYEGEGVAGDGARGEGPTDAPADAPDDGSGVAGECTPPAPAVGVPSEARTRTLAAEVLARLGHRDVTITDVYRDEWGAYASGQIDLPEGGGPSGIYVGVGFAGGERVSWANGTLARPERLGDYPLIDAAAALARLEGELNAWLTEDGPTVRPMPLPADITPPDTTTSDGDASDGDPSDGPSDGDVPTSDDSPVTILPVPEPGDDRPLPEPMPGPLPGEDMEPVQRTVTIVRIELVTSLVWTADDKLVLLPHYRLIDDEGGWWMVVAVEDRYVVR